MDLQGGVLKDFEPDPALATSLLSPFIDPVPFDAATEEYLWQICDYGWLTNAARRLSTSDDTPRPEMNPPLTLSPDVEFATPTQSPGFEQLIEGALTFDFGLLSQVNHHHQSVAGTYSG